MERAGRRDVKSCGEAQEVTEFWQLPLSYGSCRRVAEI